mgnify:CR=1 FL=1
MSSYVPNQSLLLLPLVLVLRRPGALLLPADPLPLQAGLALALQLLGRLFDYVVVDSVMSIDPVYSAVLREADQNLFVMQLNVPSAKNAERFVGCLRRMGIESTKIRIVVNRYVKKGCDIEPEEVERPMRPVEEPVGTDRPAAATARDRRWRRAPRPPSRSALPRPAAPFR